MTATNFVQLSSLGAGVAQFTTGAVSASKAGTIYVHGTTTPVILYTDETASTVLSSDGTFTTDTMGRIPGWAALGLEVDITVPPAAPVAAYTGGPPGPPAVPRGPWVNGSTYAKGEIVTFAGLPYASLVDDNFNLEPDLHAAQWLLLIALPPSLLTANSAIGGDLSGALPNPTVNTWGGQTKAQVLATQTLGGDLSGPVGAATVSTWGAQTKAQVVQAQAVGGELTGTVGSATVNAWGGQTKAQVVAGNPPRAHQASHAPGGTDVLSGLTDIHFAVANKDGVAGTASLRTLGTGAQQAVAGNDARVVGAAQKANNLSDLASAATARTSLGLPDNLGKAPFVQLPATRQIRMSCGYIDGPGRAIGWPGTSDWTVTFSGTGVYVVHNAAWPATLCPIVTCSGADTGLVASLSDANAGSFTVQIFKSTTGANFDIFLFFTVYY